MPHLYDSQRLELIEQIAENAEREQQIEAEKRAKILKNTSKQYSRLEILESKIVSLICRILRNIGWLLDDFEYYLVNRRTN